MSQMFEQASHLAEARHFSLEAWLYYIIQQQILLVEKINDPLWGMFADDPELIDEIIESTMKARETDPLRNGDG